MTLRIRKTNKSEWILLHDFYHESPEPDAPKSKFEHLNSKDQQLAISEYSADSFKAVTDSDSLIGFVGFFPDDNENINIFCVISPEHRGKGYFGKILELSIDHCRQEFSGYKYIRGLTRKQNGPSIRGLERSSFFRKGSVIEEVQPDVSYEEYLFPI